MQTLYKYLNHRQFNWVITKNNSEDLVWCMALLQLDGLSCPHEPLLPMDGSGNVLSQVLRSRGEVGLPVLSSGDVADQGGGSHYQRCKGVERGSRSQPKGCR